MKQLLQNLRSGATTVVEVPIPTPQRGEVLIRTAASLVSAGTERMLVAFAEKSLLGKVRARPDLARQVIDKARREGLLPTLSGAFNRLDAPMPLGYASAGEVVALGEGVSDLRLGERVACAGGNYAVHAEYAAVPRILVTPLPDGVDYEAAAFTTLAAIALHGFRLAQVQVGETVGVIGLGLLGLLTVMIGQAAGARVFGVDVNPGRVALARQLGATAVRRAEAEGAGLVFSHGRGCDAILICADTPSNDPVTLAGALARDRARVVAVGAVGLNLPRKVYYEKELSFINSRSYGPGRYDPQYEEAGRDYPLGYVRWTEGRNLEAVVELLAAGRIDVRALITHRFPLERAPEAYEIITGRQAEPFLGVLLTYPQAELPQVQVATAAAPLPAAPAASAFTPLTQVRLGVLGAGNFATAVLLPALKGVPGLAKVGIVSASGATAQHAAAKFGFGYAASDPERLLTDPQVNTVAILTRHHLHAGQIQHALAAGKHVFCEKPLALTAAELDELAAALAAHPELRLMVGYNRRFAPLAVRLQAALAGRAEPLAAHYRVNAGYIPLNHWVHDPEQGGGRLVGEGCHFIDFLIFLVGALPVSVSAQALPDNGRYHGDNLVATLTFPDGSIGVLSYFANGAKAFPKERVEVFCGGTVAVLDDYRRLEVTSAGGVRRWSSPWSQDKGHHGEWLAWAAALTGAAPGQPGEPPIPYDQLFGGARAVLALERARRSGQRERAT